MLYEINYLVLQSKTSELEKIRAEIKKIIESFDAKIVEEREYLKRKLSYEVSHERYGFFTVLRFEIENNEQVQEIKKSLNISEHVSRYIIVRAEELPSLKEISQKEIVPQEKTTLKQEEIEKALTEEAKKTSVSKPEKIEEPVSPKEVATSEEEVTVEEIEKVEDKETIEKEEKEKKKKKKEDEEDEEGKVSLDELDKKLDEILNL